MKIRLIVLKSFTPAALSWAKNRSPSRKLLSSTYHFFLLSITYSSMILATLSQIFGLSDGRFPEPNNARRKLRSIACARQIGLFPPPSPFIIQHSRLRSRLYPLCLEFTSRALPSRRLEKTRLLISTTSLIR